MSYHSGNQLIDPHLLFDKVQLRNGMHIADFGCGQTGHLIFPAAVTIGEQGVIYAVDILKSVLEQISKRAKMDGLIDIHPVWADIEQVGKVAIPPGSLDVVFLVNVLSQTNNRHAVLEEAKRLLKDKARLLLVDWSRNGLPFAPKQEKLVDFSDMGSWAQSNGLVVQEEFEAGPYHKGLVLYYHA